MKRIMSGYLIFCSMLWFIFLPSSLHGNDYEKSGLIKEGSASLRHTFSIADGWSAEKLSQAMLFAREAGSSAVVVLHAGKLVLEWGDTDLQMKSHSVRKSLLSALYGIAVAKGNIDLSATMKELGIDDRPPRLTDEEKQATILQLLQSRSGIYHEAAAESDGMKRSRPARGAYRPGQHWYYNNWDFNTLGTIFEVLTDTTIGNAFDIWIADPLGMQDYTADDVSYSWEKESLFPAYQFWISARDLARFGQLYLQLGQWQDRQLIPEDWIHASSFAYSKVYEDIGYGLMWWVHSSGAYYADGYKGQFVVVMPGHDMVVVNRVFTGTPSMGFFPEQTIKELEPFVKSVDRHELKKLIDLILVAKPR